MRKVLSFFLATSLLCVSAMAQTTTQQQNQQNDEDVVRISTQLIQVDAVVTDKNDQPIPDLKLSDFSLSENGKRQDLQFIEYVSGNSAPRTEGNLNVAGNSIEPEAARNLSAKDLRRVFAFVVDDLTIPYEDLKTVRTMLTDFVDKQMQEGDLVAIVRVVGGVGLLQQFTSDKQLLRRAIAELTPSSHPFAAYNNFESTDRLDAPPTALGGGGSEIGSNSESANKPGSTIPAPGSAMDADVSLDGYTRGARALTSLSVTSGVVDSMKELPGRKNLLLISGGLPVFESTSSTIMINGSPVAVQETRSLTTNVNQLLNQITDKASRAGVVINTMDVRGLKASRGVSSFTDPGNEAKSALMTSTVDTSNQFGRVTNMAEFDNMRLDTMTGHQGLEALSDATGGISVINTNNFSAGLDRVVSRSSYYILAYRPNEPFDGKFHKLQIKVDRPGAKVSTRLGYVATADTTKAKTMTKEEAIFKAAMSPLAKRDVDVSGVFQYRFMPNNSAAIDVDLRIDAKTLDFKQESNGKYHTTLDVVGFLVNRQGKTSEGFSQTINAALSPDEYQRAMLNGLGYQGHIELPTGGYQLRVAVREGDTGKLGTLSKYLEVPDMSKKRYTMSSVFLHAVNPAAGAKATPIPLTALREISRKDDLRFSAIVYNAKLDKGKPQLNTELIISRNDKIIFRQPGQTTDIRGADSSQDIKLGQIGIGKLPTGRYLLTLVVTDQLADKKSQTLVRSIDFNVMD